VTRWEYRQDDLNDYDGIDVIRDYDVLSEMNKLGQEGWEIVTVDFFSSGVARHWFVWSKRPLATPLSPQS
jgi:hypothetical protein